MFSKTVSTKGEHYASVAISLLCITSFAYFGRWQCEMRIFGEQNHWTENRYAILDDSVISYSMIAANLFGRIQADDMLGCVHIWTK